MEQLLAWECRVISYEGSTGAPMPDSYKCAVVMKKAPKDIRAFLRGHAEDLKQDFGRLKRALRTHRIRGQTYDSVGRVVSEDGERWETSPAPLPMEVDALA
eukprot:8247818-Heterocapsa_arctica.AAC.1